MLVRRDLIEAGAGCGKTHSLVVRYLEGLGIDAESGKFLKQKDSLAPSQIVALTFTEDAAEEMKSRVIRWLIEKNHHDLANRVFEEGQISTFHAYCLKSLRPFFKELGYSSNFNLLPQKVIQERRRHYLFSKLDQYPEQLEILKILDTHAICDLGVNFWFKIIKNHKETLASIEKQLNQFHFNFHKNCKILEDFTNQILSEYPKLLSTEKHNWVQSTNIITKNLACYTQYPISFATGPKNIKEDFSEAYELAKKFKATLSKAGPECFSQAALDHEIFAYRQLFEFFDFAIPQAPKWLDFEALEEEFLKLVTQYPQGDLSKKIKFPSLLLVDEFQDTSPEQLAILEGISTDSTEWYFVGDPKQSIYSFRKADVSLFLSQKDKLNTKSLSKSWRSESELLTALNKLSRHFLESTKHGVETPSQDLSAQNIKNTYPVPVSIKEHDKNTSIWDELINDIEWNSRAQDNLKHGVLFLTWNKLFSFASHLKRMGISYQISGRDKHLDHLLTSIFSDYLSWVDDPNFIKGYLNFYRWWGSTNLEALSKEKIIQESALLHQSIFLKHGELDNWQLHLQVFCDLIQPQNWQDGALWVASMEKLLVDLDQAQLSMSFSARDLSLYLQKSKAQLESSIDTLNDVIKSNDHTIQLMTIHGSKGLEFDCVYLPNLYTSYRSARTGASEDGESLGLNIQFFNEIGKKRPSLYFAKNQREAELKQDNEKLRLFYVAITRAKKKLHIYLSKPSADEEKSDPWAMLGFPQKHKSYWNSLLIDFRNNPEYQESLKTQISWEVIIAESDDLSPNDVIWSFPILKRPMSSDQNYFRGGVRRYIETLESPINKSKTHFQNKTIDRPQSKNNNNDAAVLGTEFHQLMEIWDGRIESLDSLLENSTNKSLLRSAALKVQQLPELKTYFDTLHNSPDHMFRESELLISGPRYFLNGIADAYWFTHDKSVYLLDWKTSFYLEGLLKAQKIEKIKTQLELYSKAFENLCTGCYILAIGAELRPNEEARVETLFFEQVLNQVYTEKTSR